MVHMRDGKLIPCSVFSRVACMNCFECDEPLSATNPCDDPCNKCHQLCCERCCSSGHHAVCNGCGKCVSQRLGQTAAICVNCNVITCKACHGNTDCKSCQPK